MYFPPIPTRIFLSGDISKAQGYITLGRKVLFELKRDSDWNNVPSGQRVMLLADKTKIRVHFSFGLSNIDISVPSDKVSKKVPKGCECCDDCLLIGVITSDSVTTNYGARIANVKMCQSAEEYIAFENITIIDSNPNLKKNDHVIVYATPVLKELDDLTFNTNLRTVQKRRPGKVWQFYNCMLSDNAGDPSNDLTDLGLNNQVYTVTGDSCKVAGKSIIVEPGDPPDTAPLRFFISSIKAGKCLTL
jgi:hypothetical protein